MAFHAIGFSLRLLLSATGRFRLPTECCKPHRARRSQRPRCAFCSRTPSGISRIASPCALAAAAFGGRTIKTLELRQSHTSRRAQPGIRAPADRRAFAARAGRARRPAHRATLRVTRSPQPRSGRRTIEALSLRDPSRLPASRMRAGRSSRYRSASSSCTLSGTSRMPSCCALAAAAGRRDRGTGVAQATQLSPCRPHPRPLIVAPSLRVLVVHAVQFTCLG